MQWDLEPVERAVRMSFRTLRALRSAASRQHCFGQICLWLRPAAVLQIIGNSREARNTVRTSDVVFFTKPVDEAIGTVNNLPNVATLNLRHDAARGRKVTDPVHSLDNAGGDDVTVVGRSPGDEISN